MVDVLERDLSYFRTLRNNKRFIQSYDIDSEFTSVADYLNNEIIPAINGLVGQALPGIDGSADYFLTNVGDGNVTFNPLNEVIVDSTIAASKLEKTENNGKVLVSNNAGQLDLASGPTHANMVLTYRNGNVPQYRFITTVNIEDRAVTHDDIADRAIIKEHLNQEILDIIDAPVPDQLVVETLNITGNNFNDLSITTNKFAPNTITTFNKFGIIPNTLPDAPVYTPQIILRRHVKNGTITPNKIKPYTIGSLHFNKVQCITKNKLATGIINDTFLRAKQAQEYAYLSGDSNDRTFPFTSRILAPNFRVQRQHLAVASADPYNIKGLVPVGVRDFDPAVQIALRRFGIR